MIMFHSQEYSDVAAAAPDTRPADNLLTILFDTKSINLPFNATIPTQPS